MILFGLVFWFLTPLIAPTSLMASLADLPLLAILLADKRITLARYGAFLCFWNTPYDLHVPIFWVAALRLLAVETSNFIMRHMLTEQLPRSLLASLILPTSISILSILVIPASVQGWNWKLYSGVLILPMVATFSLFAIRYVCANAHRKRNEES